MVLVQMYIYLSGTWYWHTYVLDFGLLYICQGPVIGIYLSGTCYWAWYLLRCC